MEESFFHTLKVRLIINPENLELLKNHSKRAFDRANPKIWKKVQGDLVKVEQIRGIQKRVEKLHENLKEHCEKQKSNWIAKEVVKLYQKREKLTLEHPAPNWIVNTHHSFLKEARYKVHGRINARVKNLSETEYRMVGRVAQGPEYPMKGKDLKTQVHSIVTKTQAIRTKARKHFVDHKKQWINKARQKGSQSPERDVFKKQRDRLDRIDKAEHRLIHKAFNHHGKSFIQTQQQNLSQDFDQAMG